MHLHPGWLGSTEGFGHRGYYAGDNCYGYVGHQQDRRASGQEKRTVRKAKPNHHVSLKTVATPGCHHKQGVLKDGSSVDEPRSRQGKIGLRSETSANDEAKPDGEKSLEEVVVEQDRVPEVKVETKIEAGTNSR
jgi:hypothetical protein